MIQLKFSELERYKPNPLDFIDDFLQFENKYDARCNCKDIMLFIDKKINKGFFVVGWYDVYENYQLMYIKKKNGKFKRFVKPLTREIYDPCELSPSSIELLKRILNEEREPLDDSTNTKSTV